jgi:hypothetical protein
LAEEGTYTLAVTLEAFRLVGRISAIQHGDGGEDQEQIMEAIHEDARQIDQITGGAFELVELAQQRCRRTA